MHVLHDGQQYLHHGDSSPNKQKRKISLKTIATNTASTASATSEKET